MKKKPPVQKTYVAQHILGGFALEHNDHIKLANAHIATSVQESEENLKRLHAAATTSPSVENLYTIMELKPIKSVNVKIIPAVKQSSEIIPVPTTVCYPGKK